MDVLLVEVVYLVAQAGDGQAIRSGGLPSGSGCGHLPLVGDAGLVRIVDITDVCRTLLEPTFPGCPPEWPSQSSPRGTFTGPFAASDALSGREGRG